MIDLRKFSLQLRVETLGTILHIYKKKHQKFIGSWSEYEARYVFTKAKIAIISWSQLFMIS